MMASPSNPLPGHDPDYFSEPPHPENSPGTGAPDATADPAGSGTAAQSPATAPATASSVVAPTPSTVRLVQIADDHGTDTAIVRLIATGETELIPLFTYLVAEATPNPFFLQIVTANRNLSRFSPQPFDTISLSQMLALIEGRGYSTDAIVANISYYDAEVNAIIDPDRNEATTAYIRPTTGTVHRLAETDEIVQYLELPPSVGVDRRIGLLARSGDTEVPINASDRILNHHILVAGSTGSGKSHLLSNIGHAATSGGRSVILFDHKPDHQHHHLANSDPKTQNPRAYSLNGQGPNDIPVRYWTLDAHDPNQNATVIAVRAQDLDPEILAGTIFYWPNEDLQAEIFAHIASSFADDQSTSGNLNWTIHDLINYIRNSTGPALRTRLYGNQGSTLSPQAMGAIRRKINAPSRIPEFIDPQTSASGFTGQRRPIGNINQIFDPGLSVIRINETHSRGYALFLQ